MSDSITEKFRAANSPETTLSTLYTLSRDSDELIRAAVVHNPSVSKEIIYSLLDDDSEYVQSAIIAIGFKPNLH
ncbi:hypothetical protein SM094_002418 [Cronobacter malonaticus]|nr:hypothetical protein [Cronobacter malonaticus]